ncbi:YdcF family protein [Kaistia algarum]|uniref:YdcF family protein n=1 Tax=Kaistia algarum TaxID=2083279 RepID=UPI0014029710|nr:YdcF family protein [Kaistia algarum]MCX5514278.1 YdcF family protein [Kaistia algarum]
MRRRGTRRRSPLRRIISGLLLILVLAAIGIGIDFVRFVDQVGDSYHPLAPKAEGIVALTGGAARIDGALALLAENRAERLLISGVNPSVGRREIASALETKLAGALDPRVDLGHLARDTIGNADEAKIWAEDHNFRSLIVVTSDYHMPRSMVELASAMPKIELIPYAVSNPQLEMDHWWRHAASVRLLLAEYLKYTLARARLVFESPRGLLGSGPSETASATAATSEVLR